MVLVAAAPPARAEATADEKARADALFQEAARLVDAGNAREACPKLEESERLDAGLGTEFRLADCYERVGRTASAWAGFVELAAKVKKPDQIRKARARAEALEPTLTRIFLVVPEGVAALPGLRIERAGQAVERAQWGTAVPVDPGTYRVQVRAEGRLPWETSVDATAAGATVRVQVPEPARVAVGLSGRRVGALVVGAVGIAGLAAGGVVGGLTVAQWNQAQALCPKRVNCTQEAHDRSLQVRSLSFGATAGLIGGGAAVVVGTILWLVPAAAPRAAMWVAPALAGGERGAALGGSF
jgi:hypothetical protein